MRALPFSVDRKSIVKLPHQVADGLRRCVADGIIAPGEKMPSAMALASELGVSRRVAIEALRMLAGDGIVSLRAKSRAVVNTEVSHVKNHRVLIIQQGGVIGNALSPFFDQLGIRLGEAGYSVNFASLPRVGSRQRYDIARLRAALRIPYELVVCPYARPYMMSVVKSAGQSFAMVLAGATSDRNCVGGIDLDTAGAYKSFAMHCARRRVRRVIVVEKWRGNGEGVSAALASAGIGAEPWIVPAKICIFRNESVERAAFDAFARRIAAEGKSWLPDVIYFTDESLCYGAMTAMLTYGVSVPEDVRVATIAIRGGIRAYKTTLTRIEYDVCKMGDVASGMLLDYLRTGEFPAGASLQPVYRIGGTFK